MGGLSKPVRSAAGLLVFALLPFAASGVRVEVESHAEEAIDWRKLAAVSALGAHAASAQMVGDVGGRGTVQLGMQQGEKEFRETNSAIVETLIVATLGGHEHQETEITDHFQKLVWNLRKQDGDLSAQLCKKLERLGVNRPGREEMEWWTTVIKPAESADGSTVEPSGAEYYGTRGGRSRSNSGDDGTGSVLKRYSANEPRGAEEIIILEKLLRDVKRPSSEDGHREFVRLFVRSSSGDPSEELTVTYAPLSMSLRRYLDEHDVTLMQRLGIFFDLLVSVSDVYRRENPLHAGVVSLDNVIVTGDGASAKASFCPAFFEAEVQACSTQEDFWPLLFPSEEAPYGLPEMIKADSLQLGELLEFLVHTSPDGVDSDQNAPLVFASAMKAGVFDTFEGGEGILWNFMVVSMARTMLTAYQEALVGASPASAFSETDLLTTLSEQALANPTEPSSAYWRNINKAVLAGRNIGEGHAYWAGRPTPVPYYTEAEISN